MTPTSSPGSSRESSRRANHDACAAISANAAAGQSAFPAHDVVPQRRRVDVVREGHFESRARFLVRENRGADEPRVRFRDGAATHRVPDGEPSRYELSRSVIARASNDGVRVGTLERERGDGGVSGTVRIHHGGNRGESTGRRRAELRGGPADRRTQRRLDVSIHISQMRHRERRATNHRARRREKADRARGGLGVPDGALDGAEYERRGHGRRRGEPRLRPPRRSRWDRRARSPCRASEAMPRPTARSSSPIRTRATNASRRESPRSAPVRLAR